MSHLSTSVLLYGEVNFFCMLTFALLAVKVNQSMFLQSQRVCFRLVALSAIVLYASDFLWIFSQNGYFFPSRAVNWILDAIYYIAMTALGFCWFLYSETVQRSPWVRTRRRILLASIPFALVVLGVFLTANEGWFFYVDEGNVYHRGPLYLLQAGICYSYIICTAIRAQRLAFRSTDYYEQQNFRALASFVIVPSLGGLMQIALPQLPIICACTTLGMLYVYTSLQENLISRDPLTKLSNRNQLHQQLSEKFHRADFQHPLYLMIVDVDDFKKINDTFGHVEGDHALKEIASALCRACERKDFIARFGGDEFIVLSERKSGEPIERLEERIHEEMANTKTEYPLAVTIGIARFYPEIRTEQTLISLADQDLYRKKKRKGTK